MFILPLYLQQWRMLLLYLCLLYTFIMTFLASSDNAADWSSGTFAILYAQKSHMTRLIQSFMTDSKYFWFKMSCYNS